MNTTLENTTSVAETEVKARPQKHNLPSAWKLFKIGLSFAWERLDITIPLIIFTGIMATLDVWPEGGSVFAQLVLMIVLVICVVGYLIVETMALKASASGEKVAGKRLCRLALPLVWPLVFVYFLVGLATLGGMLLLVIPGIIISAYLTFTRFVVVNESLRGFAALTRSHQLMRGVWWAVTLRILGVTIASSVVVALLTFLLAIPILLVAVLSGLEMADVTGIAFSALSGVLIMVVLKAGMVLYERQVLVVGGVSVGDDKLYQVAAGLGVLAILCVLATPIAISSWEERGGQFGRHFVPEYRDYQPDSCGHWNCSMRERGW